jgi:hypothetical protein
MVAATTAYMKQAAEQSMWDELEKKEDKFELLPEGARKTALGLRISELQKALGIATEL